MKGARLFRFRQTHRLHKRLGPLLQPLPILALKNLLGNQSRTRAQCHAARGKEIRRVLRGDAAGRHDLQHRQRREEVLDVGGPGLVGGKNLDEIRARFVGQQGFRGGKRAAGDRLAVAIAHPDDLGPGHRCDDKLRARQNRHARRLRIENAPHPHQDPVAELRRHISDHADRVRRRHGDLDRGHAAGFQGLHRLQQIVGRVGPNNGHDAGIEEAFDDFCFGHFVIPTLATAPS